MCRVYRLGEKKELKNEDWQGRGPKEVYNVFSLRPNTTWLGRLIAFFPASELGRTIDNALTERNTGQIYYLGKNAFFFSYG